MTGLMRRLYTSLVLTALHLREVFVAAAESVVDELLAAINW